MRGEGEVGGRREGRIEKKGRKWKRRIIERNSRASSPPSFLTSTFFEKGLLIPGKASWQQDHDHLPQISLWAKGVCGGAKILTPPPPPRWHVQTSIFCRLDRLRDVVPHSERANTATFLEVRHHPAPLPSFQATGRLFAIYHVISLEDGTGKIRSIPDPLGTFRPCIPFRQQ